MRREPKNESGATAVEYGLFVALIAAIILLSVQALGVTTRSALESPCRELLVAGTPC